MSDGAATTAGLQAKVRLRQAWFEAHPNQPLPEAKAEVERLFAAIEAEALAPDERQAGLREALERLHGAAAAFRAEWPGLGHGDDCAPETCYAARALAAQLPAQEERLDVERLAAAAQNHETSGIHGPLHCSLACGATVAAEYRTLGDESGIETAIADMQAEMSEEIRTGQRPADIPRALGVESKEGGAAEHEHYWVDAADDETGWHCTICGVTEYPEPPFGAEAVPEEPGS